LAQLTQTISEMKFFRFKKSFQILSLIILLIVITNFVLAQQPLTNAKVIFKKNIVLKKDSGTQKLIVDALLIDSLKISKETESKIFSDKEYIYKENKIEQGRNFLREFWDWLMKNKKKKKLDEENTDYAQGGFWNGERVSNFIILGSIIALLSGLIYLFGSGKIKYLFAIKPMETPFNFTEMAEDIAVLNIAKLIERAKESGDLRLATRWWYIKILQKLTACSFIQWKPYKTNLEYYDELKNTKHFTAFKAASLIYENVWYGEMPINEEMYGGFVSKLDELEKNIYA